MQGINYYLIGVGIGMIMSGLIVKEHVLIIMGFIVLVIGWYRNYGAYHQEVCNHTPKIK